MIHFIGLGNMGLPMAKNLSQKYPICVFDLSKEQCGLAIEAELKVLETEEVGKEATVIITALPEGKHVHCVIIENDLASKAKKGCLFIDCTTADYKNALALHQYAKSKGALCVDAPMSGGIKGATTASLTFMIGGSDDAIQQATPYLKTMGKKLFNVGEGGAGQVAKICNNMMVAISMAGTCEVLNLGYNLGLDVTTLSKIMRQASGNNWVLDCYNPWPEVMKSAPASNNYQGGFKSELMLKDLGLAEIAAIYSNSSIHLGALVRSLYAHHCQNTINEDFSSLLKHYTKDNI